MIIRSDIDTEGDGYSAAHAYQSIVVKAGVTISGHNGILSEQGSTGISFNDIVNNGEIYAWNLGVYLSTHDDSLSNGASGIIEGYIGVDIQGTDNQVWNSGLIRGKTSAIACSGTGNLIENAGTLQSGTTAFDGAGSSGVTFRNTGSIVGDVAFAAGANRFDGRGGRVDGAIRGGSGADTLIAGSDGETLQGGAGHDRLTGGAGADTFVFTSSAASASDIVRGFDAARDTLEFTHAGFSRLVADQPVAFATGTKATSASDHVFYNSGTGGLYYDADGSSTHYAATLVATLDRGLHLTARNFEVV